MSKTWYYVEKGERRGPILQSVLEESVSKKILTENDFVWTKGLDTWKKISEVEELKHLFSSTIVEDAPSILDFKKVDRDEKIFTIKIGIDRGGNAVEYGPYSLNILKKLYSEHRINGKTLIFAPGMLSWQFLADIDIFKDVFDEVPPVIEDLERRKNIRKPFVARMLFQTKKKVYEGICRDISIGGMQVLVSNPPVKIGDEISINVHPENGIYSFVANGTVVRLLDGGQGFSFRFMELSEDAKNSIESYIASEGQ